MDSSSCSIAHSCFICLMEFFLLLLSVEKGKSPTGKCDERLVHGILTQSPFLLFTCPLMGLRVLFENLIQVNACIPLRKVPRCEWEA